METAVRCGYLFFRFTNSGKTFPKKKFVQLCSGHENGCPQLLVYEDERSSMAMSNCLCMILGQEAEEAKEWQGEAAWDYFSFKIVASDYEYIFSAANEKERDVWLEDVVRIFFRSPVDAQPLQDSATESIVEYENPYKYIRKFLVTLDATTGKLLGASGCVMLSIENFYLTVAYPDGNRLGRFDICELRRYGFTDTTFNLSTGRKSMFGEGMYTFITRQGQHIYANWKEEVRLTKLTGKPKPSPGEVEADPTPDRPLFTRPGHTYEKSEDYVAKAWSSCGYTSLDSISSSGDEKTDTEVESCRRLRSPKQRTYSCSTPAQSTRLANARTSTPWNPFREHEWQIKTMMVLELAKDLCKGDSGRYCEILNHFLESHGMTPLVWDLEVFGPEGSRTLERTDSTGGASSAS